MNYLNRTILNITYVPRIHYFTLLTNNNLKYNIDGFNIPNIQYMNIDFYRIMLDPINNDWRI